VVIPAYNESRFLAQALSSLIAQTYPYWRAIVVDDRSLDATANIAVAFSERDSRIEVLRLRRNSGLPAARNAGLAQVRDPFVLFLDGDDALFPDALETRVQLLCEDDSAAGVYGKIRQVPVDATWREEAARKRRNATDRRVTLISAAGENPFGIHEVLLRTESARALGGFDESLRDGGEDVDFWARALRSGMEFPSTRKVDCLYRQTPTSMVSEGAIEHMNTVVRLLDTSWRAVAASPEVSGRTALEGDLGDVLRRGMVESRLFRYLGMVAYARDAPSFERVRSEVLDRAPLCLSPEAARLLVLNGLTRSAKRAVDPELADIPDRADEILASVATAFQPIGSELLPRKAHPSWAILVENRAQAVTVTSALAGVDQVSWPVFLLSDTVDADMGGAAFIGDHHPQAVTRSIPKLLLERVVYDVVVVPAPVTWLGRLVAQEAQDRGSSVRVLELPGGAALAVEDEEAERAAVNALAVPAEPTTPAQLGELAQGRSRQDQPRRAGVTPAVAWPGRVRPDGSQSDYRGLARPSVERLMELHNSRRGERAIIIGNGPSLNRTDLDQLKGVATFGVNGIYYADERLPEPLTFYVVEDTAVFRENTADVLAYGRTAETFLLPTLYEPACGPEDHPVFFRMNAGFYRTDDPSYCRPRFSTNACEVVYCGQSVTIINLQLAYWLGFTEIGLIGMDFSYTVPTGTQVSGALYTSAGDDPNHFDPRYFGAGKTWKDPKLNRVLANYALAKAIFESDGRRIVNCTPGGRLEAFERVDLADFTRV
jgi:glycosyltransferase involved in cell wall biosynthesis